MIPKRKPQMKREEIKKRMRKALDEIKKSGVSYEEIAYSMKMSFSTIMCWRSGLRIPRLAMIQQFERVTGRKILEN